MRRFLALGILLPATLAADGILGVGTLMGPAKDGGSGGDIPTDAIATEGDLGILTEAGQYLIVEP